LGCDCVFFFNYNRINPGLGNEVVREHMDALFGAERAQRLRERLAGLPPWEREPAIVEAMCEGVGELGAKYVLPFCFKDD
jgi:three-Cys-motif partner protein